MLSPRSAALYLLLLSMELLAAFIVAVGFSLFSLTNLGYALFWLACGVAFLALVTALATRLDVLPPRGERTLVVGAGLVAIALIIWRTAPDFVSGVGTGVLLALAYWRGISVTQEPPGVYEVQRRFGTGFQTIFVGIVGLVGRGIFSNHFTWQFVAVAGLGYVVVSLVALSMARIEERREPGALPAIILAVSAQLFIVCAIGIIALQVFSVDLAGWVGNHTQGVVDAIGATVFNALAPLGPWFDRLLSFFQPHGNPNQHRVSIPLPEDQLPLKRPKTKKYHSPNDTLYAIVGLVVVGSIFTTLIVAVWRTYHRPDILVRNARTFTERRTSLLTFRALRALLSRLLRRGGRAAVATVAAVRRAVFARPLPDDPIRRRYTQFLRRAAAAGSVRAPEVTPREFAVVLERRPGTRVDDVEILTDAYVARRYGGQAATPEEIQRVDAAWTRLRASLQPAAQQKGLAGTIDEDTDR
jgi:hypothetical protein